MQQAYPSNYQQMPNGMVMQQQEMPVTQDEMYATLIQEDRIKNIIAQISPDNQLYEIEMRIKGLRKNVLTNQWEKININAKETNPLLVGRFMSFLSAFMSQNTSLSNLSELGINRIMNVVIEYIVDALDTNSEEYEIGTNYTERTRIGSIIIASTFMILNRALNGSEARRMWSSVNVNEALGSMGQKKNWTDALKFWKQ